MYDTLESNAACCTIVIPCYNEALRLPLESFSVFLAQRQGVCLLFVDDGSTDDTLAMLQTMQTKFPVTVDVLHKASNEGKAEAVRSGMLRAVQVHRAEYTGFWDADLATPLSEVSRLLALLIEHPAIDVLLGSRVRLLGRAVTRRTTRHYSGRIFATLASLTLSLPIYDTQCGAKLFRANPTLRQALSLRFYSRWTFDVEMLARFLQAHAGDTPRTASYIYEEPLRAWTDVAGSKLRLRDSFKALGDLFHIWRTYTRTLPR